MPVNPPENTGTELTSKSKPLIGVKIAKGGKDKIIINPTVPDRVVEATIAATCLRDDKEQQALIDKAASSNIPLEVLEQVYERGVVQWFEQADPTQSAQQFAFSRVASFIAKGKAWIEDVDLQEVDVQEATKKKPEHSWHADYDTSTSGGRSRAYGKTPAHDASKEYHVFSVTVSDPNHTMVTQRKEKVQKRVRIFAKGKEQASIRAVAHFKKQGYTVHEVSHVSTNVGLKEMVMVVDGSGKGIVKIKDSDARTRLFNALKKMKQLGIDRGERARHVKSYKQVFKLVPETTEHNRFSLANTEDAPPVNPQDLLPGHSYVRTRSGNMKGVVERVYKHPELDHAIHFRAANGKVYRTGIDNVMKEEMLDEEQVVHHPLKDFKGNPYKAEAGKYYVVRNDKLHKNDDHVVSGPHKSWGHAQGARSGLADPTAGKIVRWGLEEALMTPHRANLRLTHHRAELKKAHTELDQLDRTGAHVGPNDPALVRAKFHARHIALIKGKIGKKIQENAEVTEALVEGLGHIKNAFHDHGLDADTLTQEGGHIMYRKAFFYRAGKSSEQYANNATAALKAAKIKHTIVGHGEVDKPFKGGAPIRKQSHFWVKIKLHEESVQTVVPFNQFESKSYFSVRDKRGVVNYMGKDWNEANKIRKMHPNSKIHRHSKIQEANNDPEYQRRLKVALKQVHDTVHSMRMGATREADRTGKPLPAAFAKPYGKVRATIEKLKAKLK